MTESRPADHHRPDHAYPALPPPFEVCDDAEAAGNYFFYRDRHLIVHHDDLPAVERLLTGLRFERGSWDTRRRSRLGQDLHLVHFTAFPPGLDTVGTLRALQGADPTEEPRPDPKDRPRPGDPERYDRPPARPVRVWYDHVLGLQSHTGWGTGVPPGPRPPLSALPVGENLPGTGVRVGVLDTGIDRDHPWFAGRWKAAASGADVTDRTDADQDHQLDYQAGHGTFIAGTVLQHAPGAEVVVQRMDAPGGCVSDWDVHELVHRLLYGGQDRLDVLNLSFGGPTSTNLSLPALCGVLDAALDADPDLVVVASAGNNGLDRPVWPAALPRVLGVGALLPGGQVWPRSNHGSWVSAWTQGLELSSTFVWWPPPKPRRRRRLPARSRRTTEPTFRGWAVWGGTSFAAARVSGAVAAEIGRDGRTPREVVFDLLHRTAGTPAGVVHPATFVH